MSANQYVSYCCPKGAQLYLVKHLIFVLSIATTIMYSTEDDSPILQQPLTLQIAFHLKTIVTGVGGKNIG